MAGKSPVAATEDQRAALKAMAGGADRAEADRARAILLTLVGWTSARIAEAFGVREDTVRLWRSDFMRGGVEALKASVAPGPAPVKAQAGHRQVNGTSGERRRVLIQMASGDGACVGDLAPDSKAAVTRSAAGCSRCRFWIRDVKEVRDLIVNRQEPLRLPG
jgi:Homeodomain-like domain